MLRPLNGLRAWRVGGRGRARNRQPSINSPSRADKGEYRGRGGGGLQERRGIGIQSHQTHPAQS